MGVPRHLLWNFLFGLILFENLFKPCQLYLPPQNSVLSNLRLAS
ncbi:DNA alkylation repair protein [Streptococcus pseudopneumoniae]|uniref:DNA alkylation repair protein n=1 Tax=Streptococcus pseudopneumoniae TaxID=257758 RepID=A0ABX9P779_9STRE|nr:DNA alkylation repair protein [Streptococcus pseudopneumoniae]NIB68236.1 DNA alkylation repair protein [Streptococcus pseudopneumoniae]NIB72224.1 DNA alkylation repair protein [Streptococcus pseudopneumoniae]NIB75010.1 DNA alkylation repair protein [Streptococcus pseudopneumoniae]NIB76086.1 DNA alkylation repair protein [Streptococcus pseudopneumoniae]